MSPLSLSDLQVFFGKLTENSASIYAKLPSTVDWSEEMRLTGEVTGPICEGTRTLPATIPLQYVGAEPTPLATASVPDPSFWSPAVPARYEVTLRVLENETIQLEGRQRLGLRRLGPQNRSITDQRRRTVVRAAADNHRIDQHGAEDWHEQRLHFFQTLDAETDIIQLAQQLDFAERTGFPLVVSAATEEADSLQQQLRLCSHCAAVSLVVIPRTVLSSQGDVLQDCERELPNLRLAAEVSPNDLSQCPGWSMAAVIRVDDVEASDLASTEFDKPIVLRQTPNQIPKQLSAKRRLCEQLQREFTAAGDFAGYLIG